MTAIPPYLRPQATKLPEGHDDTLDPPEPPIDAQERSLPPQDWPALNLTPGGTEPPDAPIAPPATDPGTRSLPPFNWPLGAWSPNRPLPELAASGNITLDPDIAMWQTVQVSIWPFAGSPTVGIWPKGWLGVDNTATLWVCTAGGQPGTWATVASGATLSPGTILALVNIPLANYQTNSNTFVPVDTSLVRLTFTVPPSGRFMFFVSSLFNTSASPGQGSLVITNGPTPNANLITSASHSVTVVGEAQQTHTFYGNQPALANQIITAYLQYETSGAPTFAVGQAVQDINMWVETVP